MPDKKLTDNEIVKALDEAELFLRNRTMDGTSLKLNEYDIGILRDISKTCARAYDEINHQKAEIERLEKHNTEMARRHYNDGVKEFWNQRPPQLNPNFKGKEQYNKGWNDCISFFAEEYEIFLGVKKRNEQDDCDTLVKETVGDEK